MKVTLEELLKVNSVREVNLLKDSYIVNKENEILMPFINALYIHNRDLFYEWYNGLKDTEYKLKLVVQIILSVLPPVASAKMDYWSARDVLEFLPKINQGDLGLSITNYRLYTRIIKPLIFEAKNFDLAAEFVLNTERFGLLEETISALYRLNKEICYKFVNVISSKSPFKRKHANMLVRLNFDNPKCVIWEKESYESYMQAKIIIDAI